MSAEAMPVATGVGSSRESVAAALGVLHGANLTELNPDEKAALELLIKKVLSQNGARLEAIKGQAAVVDTIIIDGQEKIVVLWEGSFNRWLPGQRYDAEQLGGRIAFKRENRVFFELLRRKEQDGVLNPAGKKALDTYRERYVRDDEGGLTCDRNRRPSCEDYFGFADPNFGALLVFDRGIVPLDKA